VQSLLPDLDYGNLLSWVAPPLVGAVIGYVTNAIAIRMLFRPLREWRVFGLRLPLTPGIIPRQRYELAESIARMVSSELLTEDAVRQQLASEGFQVRLRENIRSLLADLVHRPLSSLQGANQGLFFRSVEQFLAEALSGFFSSKSFIHGARSIVDRVIGSLGDKRVEELLNLRDVGPFVTGRLLPLLADPKPRQAVVRALARWLESRREDSRPLGELVPEQLTGGLVELVGTFLPPLFEALFRWLDEKDTREDLNRRGKRLLREVLERLNVVQRLVLSAAQYDRTLEQKMPAIVDDAVRHLREYANAPDTTDRLKGVVARAVENWRSQPIAELGQRISPEAMARLLDGWLAGLGAGQGRERLSSWANRLAARLRGMSLRELAGRYLRLQEREVAEFTANRVLEYLSRKETSQTIAAEVTAFSRRFLEEHEAGSLAEILHLNDALQERAGNYLADQIIRIVDARLPVFIESFDVRRLVIEKINHLDVAQVERLLLIVIARHLKWINLFGGLLGAIIGFSQLVLRLLR
jgi:uncharacterized membrane protein YheB (UPF0754 family)